MQTSVLIGAKNFGFFKIYGVSTWTRRFEPVRTFYIQEGGVNLSKFSDSTSFMDNSISYFKMTALLALNLKKLSFFEVLKRFQFGYFLKVIFKVNGNKSSGAKKPCPLSRGPQGLKTSKREPSTTKG